MAVSNLKIDSASWRRQKKEEVIAEAVGITEAGVPRFARFKVWVRIRVRVWVLNPPGLQGGGFLRIKLRLLGTRRVGFGLEASWVHLQGEDFGGLS